MSGCILHYGMPKTGSSSIQTWLRRTMNDPRYCYLNLGTPGSGNIMVSAFLDDPARDQRNLKRGLTRGELLAETRDIRSSLTQQLAAMGDRTAIFSAELLASIRPGELSAIVEFLGAHCRQLHAVGYVRAPVSFMQSVYQQRLKAGKARLNLDQLYPHYRRRLAKFESLLGRQDVEYWPFEPRSFPRGCVVRDFCARTGVPIGEDEIQRMNDSLSLRAIRLLYAYRHFGPGYGTGAAAMRENRDLIQCLASLHGPKLRLHADAVAPLLEREREDIRWMEERAAVSLTERAVTDENAVRGEDDLLRTDTQSLDWLGAQLDEAVLPGSASPQQIAEQVHRLRLHLAEKRARQPAKPDRRPDLLKRTWNLLRRRQPASADKTAQTVEPPPREE